MFDVPSDHTISTVKIDADVVEGKSKPKFEIEDVNFPEELKDKAKEGNSFLYKDGTYTYIS